MTHDKPRVLIVGIGAMGGVLAGRLIEQGFDPMLVAGSTKNADAITNNGIRVSGCRGEFHVPATAHATVGDLPPGPAADLVFLVTKSAIVEEVARATLPRLHENSVVVALQNGIIEPTIDRVVGASRVVRSLCNWSATMHAPGDYEHTVDVLTIIGEASGELTPRLDMVSSVIGLVTPVAKSENILGAQWSKLAVNCCVTAMGALAGAPLKVLLGDPDGRRAFIEIYREAVRTAEADGVRIEKLVLEPMTLVTGSPTEVDAWLETAINIYGNSKPSIWQDIERGRTTEIDFITGHVAAAALAQGREAPICRGLTEMIHEIERGRRTQSLENVKQLMAGQANAGV